MNLNKTILILIIIIFMSVTASAYVPPELRTSEHMSELEVVKLALYVHDDGNQFDGMVDISPGLVYVPLTAPKWANDIIADAEIHHTNSGRGLNNHAQLRQWVMKIESQMNPGRYSWVEPINEAGWAGPGSN